VFCRYKCCSETEEVSHTQVEHDYGDLASIYTACHISHIHILSTLVHQSAKIIHSNQPSWFLNLYQTEDQHPAAKSRPHQNWKSDPRGKSWLLWKEKRNLISSNRKKMYKNEYIFCSLRFFWQWSIIMTIFCDMMPCSLIHRFQNFPTEESGRAFFQYAGIQHGIRA